MKKNKKWMYAILSAVFTLAVAGIIILKSHKQQEVLPLKERTGSLSHDADWPKVKGQAAMLIQKLVNNPDDADAKVKLAELYMQEARITGDHQYYDMAALRLVNGALKKDPQNFEGLCVKSMILLSQHHFSDGLDFAEQAVAQNDYNAYARGLMIDGNVELGKYDDAVANADKMVSIRPDLSSYSRISYLREIYGDNEGAIAAMKMAVDAGFPGLEQTAWCRVQLGKLYENKGDLSNAKLQYDIALSQRPGYPYANLGEARIEKYHKNYKAAIDDVLKAKNVIADNSFDNELSELYTLNNQPDMARKTAENMVSNLNKAAESGNSDDQIGHYADKELAYAYLKLGDYDKALEHALIEYNRRPANIDVNEALAWVNYKKGNLKDADKYITVALKTNCQNPVLLCRAGIIKSKNGDKDKGMTLIKKAISLDPYLSPELTIEGSKYLAMN